MSEEDNSTAVQCKHYWVPDPDPSHFYMVNQMVPEVCTKCGKWRIPHSSEEKMLHLLLMISQKLDSIANSLAIIAKNSGRSD